MNSLDARITIAFQSAKVRSRRPGSGTEGSRRSGCGETLCGESSRTASSGTGRSMSRPALRVGPWRGPSGFCRIRIVVQRTTRRCGCARWYDPPVESPKIAIVGGGSAGLATAALLKESGLEAVVLEAGPEPGAAWRGRYDRLRLHTPRLLSGLPGLRIPRRYGRWVARDDLIEYFRAYVEAHGLDVRTSTSVTRIDRDGDGWRLETDRRAGPRRPGDRRDGLQRCTVHPRLAGTRLIRRRAHPLVRVPKSRALRRPRRPRRRRRELGRRDRPRCRRRRRHAVPALGANTPTDRAPCDGRDPGAASRDGDPKDAAELGRPLHDLAAQGRYPRSERTGPAAARARRSDRVHHDGDDPDPRRRDRRVP